MLVDTFGLGEIIVLRLQDGRTEARRLDEAEYRQWLEETYDGGTVAEKPSRGPSVIRLAISVEGQTEEDFLKSVLADHLRMKEVETTPIVLDRGGNVRGEPLAEEMVALRQSFDAVTSLVDFYGFRDKGSRTVEELEELLARKIRHKTSGPKAVIPYVQKHEFEGLLFSDVTAFENVVRISNRSIERLKEVRSQFPTPEDINDNPATAPSRRIASAIPNYRKRLHGLQVAKKMGLEKIRVGCPRFDEWVTRLEALGGGAGND